MGIRITAILVFALLLSASGCVGPQKVVDPLPTPVMRTNSRPAPTPRKPVTRRPVKPAPSPVPTPVSGSVLIDAGHGGKDPGALGVGPKYEEVVNLDIAKKVSNLLKKKGVTVSMTRNSDVFIELNERARMADRSKCALFVSIHADAASRSSASGSTIYIARNASSKSKRAAKCIQRSLQGSGIKCRGISKAGFRVLVGHSRPAVLIETGFLTNPSEAKKLAQSNYQNKIAQAIADGIADYLSGR